MGGAVAKALAAEFKALADTPLPAAKRRLKLNILLGSEPADMAGHFYARQALFGGKVQSRDDYVAAIDALSASDVQNFAKKALKAGPTLVSDGCSANYPTIGKLF